MVLIVTHLDGVVLVPNGEDECREHLYWLENKLPGNRLPRILPTDWTRESWSKQSTGTKYKHHRVPWICVLSSLCFTDIWESDYNSANYKFKDNLTFKKTAWMSPLWQFCLKTEIKLFFLFWNHTGEIIVTFPYRAPWWSSHCPPDSSSCPGWRARAPSAPGPPWIIAALLITYVLCVCVLAVSLLCVVSLCLLFGLLVLMCIMCCSVFRASVNLPKSPSITSRDSCSVCRIILFSCWPFRISVET